MWADMSQSGPSEWLVLFLWISVGPIREMGRLNLRHTLNIQKEILNRQLSEKEGRGQDWWYKFGGHRTMVKS